MPTSLRQLIEELLGAGEEAAAVRVAMAGLTRLRRPRPLRPQQQVLLEPQRAEACESCPELLRCGGDSRGCSWRWCQLSCSSCAVRCPARQDLPVWQRDVAGLGLEDLKSVFRPLPQLPPVVPVIDARELLAWGVAAEWPAWALSLAEAHSRASGAPWSSWRLGAAGSAGPVTRLREAGARRLVLSGVVNDQRLIALWPTLAQGDVAGGFDLVLAPGWSVYDDDPRLEHLFAIRQSALVADRLSRSAPVVATLHWYRRYDLDRQLGWLQRSQATGAGIDCSTLYGARRWREVLSAISYIRALLPDLELHVCGASSADRFRDLANFDRLVLYSARPAALARTRQVLDEGLRPRPGPEDPGLCLLTSMGHLLTRLGR